jgi:2-oxoglutarate dehydrogenase E1 component
MKKTSYEQLQDTSYLSGNSAPYIEALYEDFLQNPEAVGSKWRSYFESVLNGVAPQQEVSHQQIEQTLKELASQPKKFVAAAATSELQEAVDDLIRAYRDFGHIEANINPLEEPKNRDPRLSLSYHKLSEKNFSEKFMTRGVLKEPVATLKEIYTALRQY